MAHGGMQPRQRQHAACLCLLGLLLMSPGATIAEHTRALKQVPGAPAMRTSDQWGMNGELWKPTGRLMEYSYAGYAAGELPIPTLNATHNVKDYGAKGDGSTDDTAAFERAIEAMPEGVLLIPEGRYVLLRQIRITKRISLKGAGSSKTIFLLPRSLSEVYGVGVRALQAGYIEYKGESIRGDRLTSVTATARRGDNVVKVGSTAGMAVGEWISVVQGEPADGNWDAMNQGVPGGCTDTGFCQSSMGFGLTTRLAQIVDANTIVLERPLPWDLFPNFQPKWVARWAPKINNVGIEGIGLVFFARQYAGHFEELGYNGITINDVANMWIKDVTIMNTDKGIDIGRSSFITITGVKLMSSPERVSTEGLSGHHGIHITTTSDLLLMYFDIQCMFYHDVSLDKFANRNVISIGRGVNLNMDHHRGQNYGNLWTQLDFGRALRPFSSGGARTRGPHAGSFTSYWNLGRTVSNLPRLVPGFGPALNFVGLPAGQDYPSRVGAAASWSMEGVSQDQVYPPNLYFAQWGLRMSSPNKVSPQLGGKGNGGRPITAY